MSLFQKSVEKKYLSDLDTALIDKKYADFLNHFGNPEIQENIRNSKEEQYQGEFLIDLFVNILGYTKNPTPNFNLTTELKNIANSKKADGAILARTAEPAPPYQATNKEIHGEHAPQTATAVIELKGTDTTDLDKIETQAFGYKNHHPKCKYVITSNFEKLRFYIQNAVDHVDFDLFNLTREQFSLLWLCLAKDNLLNDLPLKIKESSVLQEENITKKLYADYSKFREAIYNNLVKNNPETDKLLLFKKTQKLLDRFLFIFFAEDRLLLPPNSISEIVKQWTNLKDEYDEYFPLYSRFKKYFGYMNTGFKGKKYDIYAYNGGLFKPDEILDTISIDDDILHKHTLRLSNYDFETDVDVNILGHIFEHSLGEIENIQATIADEPATPEHAQGHLQAHLVKNGEHAPRTTSKRKKDGIFYTPKYITKYIVENTVGKLCEEKRTELAIIDEEYAKGRKNRKKEIVRSLDKKLDDYRNWLLSLTILDPACGSGAFLNQALEFLIIEHRKIDELRGQLLGGAIIFSDITTDILEKNIYGVDLNEESVEIAKLSLWLRTAQKGRKLNTLSNNIKCGNSLIDDPKVAGEKAFNWQKEFPTIFQKKNKKTWHVTTATHNSRYSQRMFDNHVKKGEPVWLSEKEELIVTETIAEIVKEDKLNIVAYTICGDHAHLILACTEEELPKIVQKIKAMSARACNIAMGRTVPISAQGEHAPRKESEADARTREQAPAHLAVNTEENGEHAPREELREDACTPEQAPAHLAAQTAKNGEHAPQRGKTQFHLWTSKFDGKEITSNEQLDNTIAYIQSNRNKHKLPENKKLQKIIDEMSCSRQHAFRTEYTGGFDVVIGNPPYVHLEKIKETSIALKNVGYETYHSQGDIYCVFVEKGMDLLRPKGLISYIIPNKWMQAGYGKPLREYLLKYRMAELIDFGDIQIFEGATTYPCIFTAQKSEPQSEIKVSVLKESNSFDFKTNVLEMAEVFETSSFSGETWVISSILEKLLLDKLNLGFKSLSKSISGEANYGIKPGFTEAFIFDVQTKNKIVKEDPKSSELIHPILRGRDIKPWYSIPTDSFMICTFPALNINIEEYFGVKNHLLSYGKERLEQSGEPGSRKKTVNKWFETQDAIKYYKDFLKPKIMYQKFQVRPCFIYDEQGLFCNDSMWIIPTENKALLGVLNSKMGWWLITKYCTQIQNGCQLIWKYFGQIPVPELNSTELTGLVEKMIELTKQHQTQTSKFIKYLKSQFALEKLSRKLENWQELEFDDFIKELQKSIKSSNKLRANKGMHPLDHKLSKSDEMEWMELFEDKKTDAQTIKSEIEKSEKEIDQMVYELYGLTEEEIKIVENV